MVVLINSGYNPEDKPKNPKKGLESWWFEKKKKVSEFEFFLHGL